ncbi:hypothetical protein [Nitratifractor salsuginis]|uniref:Uncharacterized protein n=1 Tax=Nitratifractor salsuginis (strain DSM 16511 / JCM 12458 / E9I37-1) TaxID=749222 RepID=E6X1N0_NITSE|nr:hypothetical protein [Nitratifractor salsuginis]ADV47021.1 hypothetical protein Nitsa_1776 [Nitratifractor salsuginis DSM 16511]
MIKIIKIGDLVYQNIGVESGEGNGQWNIPKELEELRGCTIDTINWLIGQEVKKASGGEFVKMSAANSKAITLIVKAIDGAADKSNFTKNEKVAWDAMLSLAEGGYSDSELLVQSLTAVTKNIQIYSQKIKQALAATTIDELIEILENLQQGGRNENKTEKPV